MTIAPISSSSLSIGTARIVRAPPSLATAMRSGSLLGRSSVLMSTMWTICFVRIHGQARYLAGAKKRICAADDSVACGRRIVHRNDAQCLSLAEMQVAELASQRRVAFSSMDWNTGSSSPGELLMTCSTSEVAVCCSSASLRSSVRWRSSLSRRVFSMAITAWSAKFVTSSIVLVGEGAYFLAIDGDGADQLALLQHRYRRAACGRRRGRPTRRAAQTLRVLFRLRRDIGELNTFRVRARRPERDMRGGANDRLALITFGQGGH